MSAWGPNDKVNSASNPYFVSGGSVPSAAFSVTRTNNIDVTSVLISAADTTRRRAIRNVGTVNIEIVPAAGAAFGTGFLIAPGEVFTFDDQGRTSAALYAVAASAGGAVAVMSF